MTTHDNHASRPQRGTRLHHPVVEATLPKRTNDLQIRIADAITAYAGSMKFVYVHIVLFAVWMLFFEKNPWPKLTLAVSLEAIFLRHDRAEPAGRVSTGQGGP
jgi:uncharacterized membrane protein